MAVREADIAALELERLVPKIRKVYEQDDMFYTFIRNRPAEKISNRSMRIPLELRPGGAFQYFNADGGDLGRGSGPKFDKAVVNAVFMSENIEYTKLVEWSGDDPRKAIVDTVRRLTAGALDELRRQIDAQLMQDGSGKIGVITSVSTTSGVDTYTCTTDGFGVRLMRYGQVVQVFDTTGATYRGKGTITGHDVVNKTIDVTPAIANAAATDILVTDGISSPLANEALLGVPYHHSNASTGTWLGFSRSSTPEIRSNRVNGNASALALASPRLAMNMLGNRMGQSNGFNPIAWMHPAQIAAYEEQGQLVQMITRSGTGDKGLDLYFGGAMQMAGAKVKGDFNWDKTRIDFIDEDVWGRAEILPLGFYKTDGRNIFEIRGASGGVATADIFYMVVGMQTFVTNPGATAYIDNLAVPDGY